jgi:hypothetical protein
MGKVAKDGKEHGGGGACESVGGGVVGAGGGGGGAVARTFATSRTRWLNLASCSSFPNTYGGPRSVSVKHVWKNVARRRTKNSTKNFFWVRAGHFVGCRESLQSAWGELLKEKEISPCLTVRADW